MQREIRIHSQLQHKNIVQLYAAFEDSDHVYLALEYANGKLACLTSALTFTPYFKVVSVHRMTIRTRDCGLAGGDLYEELKRCGGHLSEERVASDILRPCLAALAYLHLKVHVSNTGQHAVNSLTYTCLCAPVDPACLIKKDVSVCAQGYLWRDCKPENILLAGPGLSAVKLADFGLSIDSTEERPVTRAGTLDYMAPEVGLQQLRVHGERLGVFFGVSWVVMLWGSRDQG